MMHKKTVYVGMSADLIHPGHVNVIKTAREYGEVIVGLLTDSAISSYKKPPVMSWQQRESVVSLLQGVTRVVRQESLDYTENLELYRPDYVVHGDDWRTGIQKETRNAVVKTISAWGGELIEVPYTEGISSSAIKDAMREIGSTPDIRRGSLKRLLAIKPLLRFLDVHSALTGLIIEHLGVTDDRDEIQTFDGMWASSLTDSTSKGRPDIESVDTSSRLLTLNEILEVTSKPIIYDGDTGGIPEHFQFTVRSLERLGISAVIIEDKTGLKKNSLFGTDVYQELADVEQFCEKIKLGKKSQITSDFMIIARLESLIVEAGLDDAKKRCVAYLQAGADGIMIHSKDKSPDEVLAFCHWYSTQGFVQPLVAVPSTYNSIYEHELVEAGVDIVIYANHLLRAAYPAMIRAGESILSNKRSLECDNELISISKILDLIPGTR